LFHEPSSDIVTPRCLWYFTSSSCWLYIISDGWCGLLTIREITIVSVFSELKLTNHLLDQDVIVFKSLLTIRLAFLPYFPYLFTIQLAFLLYCPYLITIRLAFLPYFPYLFTIELTFLP
jgi:hypothetical protein